MGILLSCCDDLNTSQKRKQFERAIPVLLTGLVSEYTTRQLAMFIAELVEAVRGADVGLHAGKGANRLVEKTVAVTCRKFEQNPMLGAPIEDWLREIGAYSPTKKELEMERRNRGKKKKKKLKPEEKLEDAWFDAAEMLRRDFLPDKRRTNLIANWVLYDRDASGDLSSGELRRLLHALNFDDVAIAFVMGKVAELRRAELSFLQFSNIFQAVLRFPEVDDYWRSIAGWATEEELEQNQQGGGGAGAGIVAGGGAAAAAAAPAIAAAKPKGKRGRGGGGGAGGGVRRTALPQQHGGGDDEEEEELDDDQLEELDRQRRMKNSVCVDDFTEFLVETQKEKPGAATRALAEKIISQLGGILDKDSFVRYLTSTDLNCIHDIERAATLLSHDMRQPLCHYFVNSSHNTYLTGNQLSSDSDPNMYRRCLKEGCRSVEIDIWDGPHGKPIVYHGFTRTSKISFDSVIEAINDSSFTHGDQFPVTLSFELHVCKEQQDYMVDCMERIFGDKLARPTWAPGKRPPHTVSPWAYRNKILIKSARCHPPRTKPEVEAMLALRREREEEIKELERKMFEKEEERAREREEAERRLRRERGEPEEEGEEDEEENEREGAGGGASAGGGGGARSRSGASGGGGSSSAARKQRGQQNQRQTHQRHNSNNNDDDEEEEEQELDPNDPWSKVILPPVPKRHVAPTRVPQRVLDKAGGGAAAQAIVMQQDIRQHSQTMHMSSDLSKLAQQHRRLMLESQRLAARAAALQAQESDSSDDDGDTAEKRAYERAVQQMQADPLQEVPKHKKSDISERLSALVMVEARRIPKLDESVFDEVQQYNVTSFSENRSRKQVRSAAMRELYQRLTRRQVIRVYPHAARFNSSNFHPQEHWNVGAQMVAINWQTDCYKTRLAKGRFALDNANCGYLLKPRYMRSSAEPQPTAQTPGVQLTVRVLSAFALPKPEGASAGSEVIDPYVVMFIEGPFCAGEAKRAKTCVIDDNGFHPVWKGTNTETAAWHVPVPEMSTLVIQVWDEDLDADDFIAEAFVPVDRVRSGVRSVPLHNSKLKPVANSFVLVHAVASDLRTGVEGGVPLDPTSGYAALAAGSTGAGGGRISAAVSVAGGGAASSGAAAGSGGGGGGGGSLEQPLLVDDAQHLLMSPHREQQQQNSRSATTTNHNNNNRSSRASVVAPSASAGAGGGAGVAGTVGSSVVGGVRTPPLGSRNTAAGRGINETALLVQEVIDPNSPRYTQEWVDEHIPAVELPPASAAAASSIVRRGAGGGGAGGVSQQQRNDVREGRDIGVLSQALEELFTAPAASASPARGGGAAAAAAGQGASSSSSSPQPKPKRAIKQVVTSRVTRVASPSSQPRQSSAATAHTTENQFASEHLKQGSSAAVFASSGGDNNNNSNNENNNNENNNQNSRRGGGSRQSGRSSAVGSTTGGGGGSRRGRSNQSQQQQQQQSAAHNTTNNLQEALNGIDEMHRP